MCNFFVMSDHYSPRSLAARKPLTTAGTLEEISGAGNSYNMKTLLENALAARRPLAVAGKKTPLVSQHRTLLNVITHNKLAISNLMYRTKSRSLRRASILGKGLEYRKRSPRDDIKWYVVVDLYLLCDKEICT